MKPKYSLLCLDECETEPYRKPGETNQQPNFILLLFVVRQVHILFPSEFFT